MSEEKFRISSTLYELGSMLHQMERKAECLTQHEDFSSGTVEETVATIIQLLPTYSLTPLQLKITAYLWLRCINSHRAELRGIELVKTFWGESTNYFHHISNIIALLHKNILCVQKSHPRFRPHPLSTSSATIVNCRQEYEVIRGQNITIHPQFFNAVMESDGTITDIPQAESYTTNEEYLNDWFTYVNALSELPTFDWQQADDEDILQVKSLREKIERREKNSQIRFPLQELRDEYKLDENELCILTHLLYTRVMDRSTDTSEALALISPNSMHRIRNQHYFEASSKLVIHELVDVMFRGSSYRSSSSSVTLSPFIVRRLLGKQDATDTEKLNDIIRDSRLFNYVEPEHSMDDVVIPLEVRQNISTALHRYNTDVRTTLSQWGIYRYQHTSTKKRLPKLVLLFHGEPGTGKTHTAYALAKTLGKHILRTEISTVLSSWVGESEQNIRRIFTKYKRIIEEFDNPPILLLNECDQFLGTRSQTTRAVDKMYNQMQDILLEELECFEGICIMTTNVIDFLDTAYSRRIDFKICFQRPDVNERTALWRIHLPECMPGVADVDIPTLAQQYNLTGGQIALVVENAATEAASRQTQQRYITTNDIQKYARIELDGQFEYNQKRIGF